MASHSPGRGRGVVQRPGRQLEGTDCNVPHGELAGGAGVRRREPGQQAALRRHPRSLGDAENSRDKTAFERVANSLAGTRMMYLMANQLPLLDVGRPGIGSVTLERAGRNAGERQHRPGRLRPVVAPAAGRRRDRADDRGRVLRSQRSPQLPDRSGPSCRQLEGFRIVNVIVSNDTTYFNYVERPDTAHCGYAWNPHVFGMLAKGYQAGKSLPVDCGPAGRLPGFHQHCPTADCDDQPL